MPPQLALSDMHAAWWPPIEGHVSDTLLARPGILGEMIGEAMGAGGKRLRALLPCALAQAVGHDPQSVAAFGAACEVVHNGTLVHDDYQDGDTTRRGKPALWTVYGPAQAINCGSAMYVLGLQLVQQADAPPQARFAAAARLQQGLYDVIDGQAREFLDADRLHPSWAAWRNIVRRKTGALFGATLAGTAELVPALAVHADALWEAGLLLGELFQMQDDLLDMVADKGREQRGSDLAEGKISAVVLEGLARLEPEGRARLLAIVSAPRHATSGAAVQEGLALLARCAAYAAVGERLATLRAEVQRTTLALPATVGSFLDGVALLFLEPVREWVPAHTA